MIVDSIQDWRDPNEEHRLNGAESDYYLGLPVPYRSKNADFDSVDELLQVKGVTRALLYGRPEAPGLAEHLTVFGTNAVHVNTASPVVLRALGFAPAEVDVLIGRRPYADPSAIPPGLRRGNPRGQLRDVPHRGLGGGRGARRARPHGDRRAPGRRRGTGPGGTSRLALVRGCAAPHGTPGNRHRHGPKPVRQGGAMNARAAAGRRRSDGARSISSRRAPQAEGRPRASQ